MELEKTGVGSLRPTKYGVIELSQQPDRRAPYFAYGEAESNTLRCASKLNKVGAGENPAIPPILRNRYELLHSRKRSRMH